MTKHTRGSASGRARAHATKIRRSRAALIRALQELVVESFEKYGTGVTVTPREIADRAGLSTSTLYNRFPDGIGEIAVEAVAEHRAAGAEIHPHLLLLAQFYESSLPTTAADSDKRALMLSARAHSNPVSLEHPSPHYSYQALRELEEMKNTPGLLSDETRAQVLVQMARSGIDSTTHPTEHWWREALEAQRVAGFDLPSQIETLKGATGWWWGSLRWPHSEERLKLVKEHLQDLHQAALLDDNHSLIWVTTLLIALADEPHSAAGTTLLAYLESTTPPSDLTSRELERIGQMAFTVIQLRLVNLEQAQHLVEKVKALYELVTETDYSGNRFVMEMYAAMLIMYFEETDLLHIIEIGEHSPRDLLPSISPESGLCTRTLLGLPKSTYFLQDYFIGRASSLLLMTKPDVEDLCIPITGPIDRSSKDWNLSDDNKDQRISALRSVVLDCLNGHIGEAEEREILSWVSLLVAEVDTMLNRHV